MDGDRVRSPNWKSYGGNKTNKNNIAGDRGTITKLNYLFLIKWFDNFFSNQQKFFESTKMVIKPNGNSMVGYNRDYHQFENQDLVPAAINGVRLGWIKPWQLLPFCWELVKLSELVIEIILFN